MLQITMKSERGIVTVIALIMVGMLTLIGLAALSTSDDEVSIAGNELQEMRAFYAAESGLDAAGAALQHDYEVTGVPPTNPPSGSDSVNGCIVSYFTTDDGAATQRTLTTGTLAGLHALVKSFTISSVAVKSGDNSRIALQQSFETALVPIFQFAVFYGQDLEIDPGPDMTLIGRVHSNGDMFLNPASNLRMDSYVTASGELLRGSKGTDPFKSGDVFIKDASGNYVSMRSGSDWVDNNYADWYDSSISKWDGRVQDEAHGAQSLNVPISNSGDPHKLIERAASNPDSYENKATLKFIDGQAYSKVGGVWQNVTANMIADGVITQTSDEFYDQREYEWVDAFELDVQAMYDHGYAPSNGVIYFSDEVSSSSDWPALRLHNAEELGDGLTIACENPIYTVGNFNSVDKKPASFISDALTVLSASFDDSKSTLYYTNRVAQSTTINASYVTGGVETGPGVESGGFHNLPRFLEYWGGRDFRWTGSAIHLWYSQQATATWRPESGGYYRAPTRVWAYDTDLDDPNKLPPETPVVRVFQRTGWRQVNVGYAQSANDFDWDLAEGTGN
ncbi:pilus assembly PilX N-terminal domain-containing protein [bacterium]|nr:pilus assembly PilX N-terminal domain-containing protein [bacterium]